jgi:hypothetical protein
MATPEGFGNRRHFDGDGCDKDSIRHAMSIQAEDLQNSLWGRGPNVGKCPKCGKPVMEEEFDCGRHGVGV